RDGSVARHRPRRLNAKLLVAEDASKPDDDVAVGGATILDRERVYGCRNVSVPAEGREDRSANHDRLERRGEHWHPAEGPLPRHPDFAELMDCAIDLERGSDEGGAPSVEKPGVTGELDRAACPAVDDAHG